MKQTFKLTILLIGFAIIVNSCKQRSKSVADDEMFVMEGFIEGAVNEYVYIGNWDGHRDSAKVVDGKFTLRTKLEDPCLAKMYTMDGTFFTMILADNCNYTLKGQKGYNTECIVKGGVEQEYLNKFNKKKKVLQDKYQYYELDMKLRENGLSKEEIVTINEQLDKYYKEEYKLELQFIKENPKAHYSIELIEMKASGDSKEEIENFLAQIDPKLKSTRDYRNIQALLEEKKNDVSLGQLMKNATPVNYQLDNTFTGKSFTEVLYMGVMTNNNICALKKNGTVQIISPEGHNLNDFNPEIEGIASVLAVDEKCNTCQLSVG